MDINKELTKAELQIMNILWDYGPGFVNDIISKMDEPKPAYTTISTIVRILVNKGFVTFEAFGKTHRYSAVISRENYMENFLNNIKQDYFKGSFSSLVSFFSRKEKLSKSEIQEIVDILNDNQENL